MTNDGANNIQRYVRDLLCATALTAILQGCVAINGFPDRAPPASLAALDSYLKAEAIAAYYEPDGATRKNMSRREWRNAVISSRLHADNENFNAFEQTLYRQGVGAGVGTDWVLLALTSAGSLAGSAANALSAAATGVTGARAGFDKNVMYEKTLPILMAQMVAKRKTVLVRIRQGLALDEIAYPLEAGLSDLDDYYFAGTIPGAIGEVASNSSEQAKSADKELKAMLVGLVEPSVQARREKAANYVKTLDANQLDALAKALGKPGGSNALIDILQALSQAESAAKVDFIDQKISAQFGTAWRN